MILYLDTSSLVKLYVEEKGAEKIKKIVTLANSIITSTLSYVEAKAAFSRKKREGGIRKKDYHRVIERFTDEWEGYYHIEVTREIYKSAGALAESYALKAYDAVHLASYQYIKSKLETDIMFSSFDNKLNKIVRAEENEIL